VLILVCLCATIVGAAPGSGAFGIGVLRRDGIVVPFAEFDGHKWRPRWPEPKPRVEVPIQLADVPARWWGAIGPAATWQIWVAGRPPQSVHVKQPDVFPVQCTRQIGLRTDYRPTEIPPPLDTQPYPKDGLATAPPHAIERIDIVPPASAPPPVVEAFEQQARAVLARARADGERLSDALAAAPQVEAVYAVGDPAGTRVYYFELSMRYRDSRDPSGGCPAVVFAGGWFVRDGSTELRKLKLDAAVVGCERTGLTYMLPLGAVRLNDRLYWIAQWSGWDYEEYAVVEIKAHGVEDAVRVWGGGC
jgi:hypothetical protein